MDHPKSAKRSWSFRMVPRIARKNTRSQRWHAIIQSCSSALMHRASSIIVSFREFHRPLPCPDVAAPEAQETQLRWLLSRVGSPLREERHRPTGSQPALGRHQQNVGDTDPMACLKEHSRPVARMQAVRDHEALASQLLPNASGMRNSSRSAFAHRHSGVYTCKVP